MWVGPSLVSRFRWTKKTKKAQKCQKKCTTFSPTQTFPLSIYPMTSFFIGLSRSVQKFIFSIGSKMSGCPRLYFIWGNGEWRWHFPKVYARSRLKSTLKPLDGIGQAQALRIALLPKIHRILAHIHLEIFNLEKFHIWQIGSSQDWMLSPVYEERSGQNCDNFRQFREGHSLPCWDGEEEIEQKVLKATIPLWIFFRFDTFIVFYTL